MTQGRCLDKINDQKPGIWRYENFFEPEVESSFQLTDGEGNTPLVSLPELAHLWGVGGLWVKREDQNPHGSHKDRSLAYRISLALQQGVKQAVISSSGNAAISAVRYCQIAGIELFVFVSPETPVGKLKRLVTTADSDIGRGQRLNAKESQRTHSKTGAVHILISSRAMRMANYVSKNYNMPNLRPSLDDYSIEGFRTIGFEIYEQVSGVRYQVSGHRVDHVFTFVTSGSSFVGMGKAFKQLVGLGCMKKSPALHAVQAGEAISVVHSFDQNNCSTSKILDTSHPAFGLSFDKLRMTASAGGQSSEIKNLGVKQTRRTDAIVDLIRQSGGNAWAVLQAEIDEARQILKDYGIGTSWEGCACLAAIKKSCQRSAISSQLDMKGKKNVVCILSGRYYADEKYDITRLPRVESLAETDKYMEKLV